MSIISTGTITTNDGVGLSFRDSGSGSPVVLVHGWQQSAELWKHQIEGLSGDHRVISWDMRGHGGSDRPDHGYKVHRMAADLADLVAALDLDGFVLIGHSMGCQVVLAYLELFGQAKVAKIVLVDEPIFLTADPSWDEKVTLQAGAIFSQEAVLGAVNGLAGAETHEATVRGFIDLLTSPSIAPEDKEWIVQQNLLVDGIHSGSLFYNHAHQDWRTQLSQIAVPTLVIAAEGSIVPVGCLEWAVKQIPDARLSVFGADEGGSHFMFIENPQKFNAVVSEFVG